MQWSDVTAAPNRKTLRQFAGLWLLFFGSLALWRAWHGLVDVRTEALGALAVVVGGVGLAWPAAIRWIYTGWMTAAFPIGWAVSRLVIALLFYLMFTPLALVFRLMGRDLLRLHRTEARLYWVAREQPASVKEYFRQS